MVQEEEGGKFSDMLISESGGGGVGSTKENRSPGVRLSYPTAFILLLGALALAGTVGVVVHFLHPCPHRGRCGENNTSGDGETGPRVHGNCANLSQQLGKCLKTALDCSAQNATPTPTPTPTPLSDQPPSNPSPLINYRLPNTLRPLHYNIQLRPNIYLDNPADFNFEGFSQVLLDCTKSTDLVVLHLLDLHVEQVEIVSEAPRVFIHNRTEDKVTQFLNISLSRALRVGEKVMLSFAYKGRLEAKTNGLYYRRYKERNATRYMVASLLAPTFARSVFPCMDEPSLKATFNVTLLYKHPMVALSNMPNFTRQDRGDGWISENYTTTPLMSTYLLAFIVAEYDYIDDTTDMGLHAKYMRYWGTPTSISSGHLDYAQSMDGHMFDYYESYFNESYILLKQDSVVVPGHKGGAMENWGLITYRESRLLFDPLYTSSNIKQRMTATQAHELVHMWLGNIVTCDWWDDTWLQEGFARYFQHYGQGHVHRTWDMEEIFLLQVFSRVLVTDSAGYQQPVTHPVHTPADASAIFGTITYDKGGTLIRMMQNFLGEETFGDAIRAYIKKYAYSTATTQGLLEVISQIAERDGSDLGGRNVTQIMLPWLTMMGYPLVTLSGTTSPSTFSVTQKMYQQKQDRTLQDGLSTDYLNSWSIPLTYQTRSSSDVQQVWFHTNRGAVTVTGNLSEGDWILANINRVGLYRVNYDEQNWAALQAQLMRDHTAIPYINRAQLIDDAFCLFRSGEIDIVTAMSMTEYLTQETRYLPFFVLMRNIGALDKLLYTTDVYGQFRAYMRHILTPIYERVGWKQKRTDLLSDIYMRTDVLMMACDFGLGPCTEEARKRFKAFRSNPTDKSTQKIRPDIRQVVYCHGIRYGSEEDWEFLLEQFGKEENLAESWMMRTSISCTKKLWQLKRLFQMTLDSNSSIPNKGTLRVEVLSNSAILPYIWRYLTIDVHKGPSNESSETLVYLMLDELSQYITTRDEQQKLEDSLGGIPLYKVALFAFRISAERNIRLHNANYDKLKTWLTARNLQ